MSARSQRGRAATRQRRSPLPVFYIILGLIAIVGVAAIGTIALRGRSTPTTSTGTTVDRVLNAPTGQTPEGYFYKGKPDAPVTVVEYSDYQCPFCGRFATSAELQVDADYVETGKIKYVFHDYPLQQHPNAIPAAIAARCTGDPKLFWEMHNLIFANQAQWENLGDPTQQFLAYARQLKINESTFQSCLSSQTQRTFVEKAVQEGNQVKIPGTPTFFVNGQQVGSDPAQLRAAIDAALAK